MACQRVLGPLLSRGVKEDRKPHRRTSKCAGMLRLRAGVQGVCPRERHTRGTWVVASLRRKISDLPGANDGPWEIIPRWKR